MIQKINMKNIGLGLILIGYAYVSFIVWLLINVMNITLSFYSVLLLLIPLLIFVTLTVGYFRRFFNKNFKLLSIVFIFFLFLPQLYFTILIYNNEINSNFSKERWFNKPDERVYIVDDMLESYSLKGKTSKEIITLLGKPSYNEKPNILVYYLGPQRGFGVDYEWLFINLDSMKKVISWEVKND